MGKGTIVSNIGAGRYLVTIHYERSQIESRIAAIDEQVTLNNTWLGGEGSLKIAIAELDRNEALDAWNAAIAAYDPNSENASQQADLIESTGRAYAEAQATLDVLYIHRDKRLFQNKSLELEKQFLLRVPGDGDYPLWSADLTEDWQPGVVVGLLETPNTAVALPDIGTLILPGSLLGNEKPPWNGENDGILQHTGSAIASAIWWNTAMSAAMDKWRPGYRFGVISNLRGNICDITLDTALSRYGLNRSANGQFFDVNVNIGNKLLDVPIVYMDCDGQAFENDDHVVVQFIGRSWENPQVIGFVDNPKPCGGWVESFGASIYNMIENSPEKWPEAWVQVGEDPWPISKLVYGNNNDVRFVEPYLFRTLIWDIPNSLGTGDRVVPYMTRDNHKIIVPAGFVIDRDRYEPYTGAGGLILKSAGQQIDEGFQNTDAGCIIFPGDCEFFNLPDTSPSTDFPIWDDWTDCDISFTVRNFNNPSGSKNNYAQLCVAFYYSLNNYLSFGFSTSELIGGYFLNGANSIAFATCLGYCNFQAYVPGVDTPDYALKDMGFDSETGVWSNYHTFLSDPAGNSSRACWIWQHNNPVPPAQETINWKISADYIRVNSAPVAIAIKNRSGSGDSEIQVHSIRFYRNL